jgi:hypothetical protein
LIQTLKIRKPDGKYDVIDNSQIKKLLHMIYFLDIPLIYSTFTIVLHNLDLNIIMTETNQNYAILHLVDFLDLLDKDFYNLNPEYSLSDEEEKEQYSCENYGKNDSRYTGKGNPKNNAKEIDTVEEKLKNAEIIEMLSIETQSTDDPENVLLNNKNTKRKHLQVEDSVLQRLQKGKQKIIGSYSVVSDKSKNNYFGTEKTVHIRGAFAEELHKDLDKEIEKIRKDEQTKSLI